MLRKLTIQALAFLLVALPLLGVLGKESLAAESSRVAIISQLSGDVQVQKSGGSKKIKAFKKLNLNQGDILFTGSSSSATLQFSNGTSSDDTMTAAANTTLKFSKLSSNGSTVTKVSMLKGSAWVDVKSIKSKDDQFQVETPTAIMGVRGTNFLVLVNPNTGSTNTSVFAGVVQLGAPSLSQPPSIGGTPTLPNPGAVLIYPTNQINVTPDTPSSQLPDQVSMVNLPALTSHLTPELIEAILRSYGKIQEENQQFIDKLKNGTQNLPPVLGTDIQVVEDNLTNLIGAALQQALGNHAITQEQLNSLIQQVEQAQGKKLDLPSKELTLTDLQKKKQEELEKKEQMLAAQEAEKRKQQLAEQQKQLALLAQQKKEQDAKNLAEAERLRKEAEAKLLAGMTEQQKKDYLTNQSNLNGTPPPSSPGPSESSSSNSDKGKLTGLTLLGDGIQLSPNFSKNVYSYSVNLGENYGGEIGVHPTAAATATVTIAVDGVVQEGSGSASFQPSPDRTMTKVTITVTDGSATKTYTILVKRLFTGVKEWSTLVNGEQVSWDLSDSYISENDDDRSYQLYFEEAPESFKVNFTLDDSVSFEDVDASEAFVLNASTRSGSLSLSRQQWHSGANDASIYYRIGEGEATKRYYLRFTVYIGTPELRTIYAQGADHVSYDFYPAGDHKFSSAVIVDSAIEPGEENATTTLTINPVLSEYWRGSEGSQPSIHITMGETQLEFIEGYQANLERGWNELTITMDNPAMDPSAPSGVYDLMIWVGDSLPEDLRLNSIEVTNGEATPSIVEGPTLEWSAYVNSDNDGFAYIDPAAPSEYGASIDSVHYEDYELDDYFAEARNANGKYAIPLQESFTVAYVTVRNEEGRYMTYVLYIEAAPLL
ncbi:FecR domain-containing protein [Cohnella sp. AR92]|uniref:FecR domain-containing protein n=1 Tax=Cohnella sp. AR92 TaxID=648716 RepID=UPI000F8F4F33|nr:FecR domain-containing protein [Cohnella sp. AR92]RUS49176.1 hypothetical protein ELR57_02220 [Cohnella sp. AR92]